MRSSGSFWIAERAALLNPNVNPVWLLRGKGDMLNSQTNEAITVNNFDGGTIGVLAIKNSGTVKNINRANSEAYAKLKAENEKLTAQLEAKEEIIANQKDVIESYRDMLKSR